MMPIDQSSDPFDHTDDLSLVVQTLYDPQQDDELGTKVVDVVTSLPEIDADDFWDLPPLYDAVDVDAVERTFFGPQAGGVERLVEGVVSFEYLRHVIAVRNDGWIFVYNS
jgi:hypothetical protein